MKNNLIFLTDNLFLRKDYERFEIKNLSSKFNVKILSLNKKNKNQSKLINFDKISDLNNIINFNKKNFLIDLLGINLRSWKIRFFLKKKKVKFIKLYLGSIPFPPKKNLLLRIYESILQKSSGGSFLNKLINNILILINKNFIYDYLIFAGNNSNKYKIKSIKKIEYNSYDYRKYLLIKNKNKKKHMKNFFVFIDNNILYHPDYKYHLTKPPVTGEIYYQTINNFFSYLEKKYKVKILIALNPKSNYLQMKKLYPSFRVFKDNTDKLVFNSKAVILHQSTALSFAILHEKPITFITTDEINKSWFKSEIYFAAKKLNTKVYNINKKSDIESIKFNLTKVMKKSYKSYIYNYLSRSNKYDMFSFADILKNNLCKI